MGLYTEGRILGKGGGGLAYIQKVGLYSVVYCILFEIYFMFLFFYINTATGDGDNILRFCPCFQVVQLMKNVSQFYAGFY
jgi:hypothetical protein